MRRKQNGKNITDFSLSIRHILLSSLHLRKKLFGQKENAKSRFRDCDPFSLLSGWREEIDSKNIPEPFDHTRTALENDRSIDREKHAEISTRDLLALVQLGEICKNVCKHRTIAHPPFPSWWAVVSIRVLIRNEIFVREIMGCLSLNVSRLCKFYDT